MMKDLWIYESVWAVCECQDKDEKKIKKEKKKKLSRNRVVKHLKSKGRILKAAREK